MTTFDLIRQPWVPVTVAGQREDVSLLDALTQAHEMDGLGLDDPLQAVAVLRQALLPVVVDALGVPRDEGQSADRWDEAVLDSARIGAYLDEHAARFDLFDETAPFAQVAGLRTEKNELKSVSLLIPAMASGNNVPLFSVRTEADPPSLTPAQAARALLAAHCWDTAAIKSGAVGDPQTAGGKTTGNPTGPLGQLGVIVPLGRNLAETLLLNVPIVPAGLSPSDRPHWRRPPADPTWMRRPAEGLLDLLTWQSRRIRLVPEGGDRGEIVVRHVVLAAGDRLDHTPGDVEPHTAWRENPKPRAGEPPSRPVRHQAGRSAWRGLAAILATSAPTEDRITSSLLMRQIARLRAEDYLPSTLALQVLTVGVEYGNQSAVVEDVMTDQIPLPVLALMADSPVRGLVLEVVHQAEDLRQAANRLGDDLRAACGAEKLPWDRSQRLGDMLVHAFTPVVRRMLAGLQRDPGRVEAATRAWRQAAHRLCLDIAEPALAATPPEAFLGREVSERVAHRLATAEARYRAALTRVLGSAPSSTEDPPSIAGV